MQWKLANYRNSYMYSEQAQACTLGSYTKPGTSLYTQVYQKLPAWKLQAAC